MAARDLLIAGVILFALSLIFFTVNYISNTAIDSLITFPEVASSTSAVEVLEGTKSNVTNRLDYVLLGVLIALILGILITGFLIGAAPIFITIYIIIWILSVVICSVLTYFWQQFTPTAVFGTTINHFPITDLIMNWLPMYIAIIGFMGLVAMYAKPYFFGE